MKFLGLSVLSVFLIASSLEASVSKIKIGMSREEVRTIAGEPAKELRSGFAAELWWYGDSKKSCVIEFHKGFVKGPAECDRPDLKFDDAEMITYQRESSELQEYNDILREEQKIRAKQERERKQDFPRALALALHCGPKPAPAFGCKIERCVNQKWEEVCQ